MNAPVTAEVDETLKIEDALDALLSAALRADRDPSLLPERGVERAGVIVGELLDKISNWTLAQRQASDLLHRPVAEACRQGVHVLGERLYEIGGVGLMREVLHRVAERDPANEGRRIGLMDHRWSGIGDERGGMWLA